MKNPVRTRIAPSPTGEDLHIGSVYMALFNYVFAKKHGGKFIIRIEDTDRERYVRGAEERMLSSLKWVGIPHDEGVGVGGPHAPYRQSERLPIYQKYATELIEKKAAYYCFCTPLRLAEMRQYQQKAGKPPMYDGRCKQIIPAEAEARAKKEKYVIRLQVPDSGVTRFNDLVRGEIVFENKLLDDQVLIKSDGFPTYHLAVVVDDHLMQITHVIRGEEWISSTPKHILLYKYFGWEIPEHAHLPLLRNPDKSKLSKRKNPVWTSWFRSQGFLPRAILNYLGTITWSFYDGRDFFTLSEMIDAFTIKAIKTTAPIFDLTKLTWFNSEYIRRMSNKELLAELQQFLPKDTRWKLIGKLVPLARERMKTLAEFSHYLKPFVKWVPFKMTEEQKELVGQLEPVLQRALSWKSKLLEEEAKKMVTKNKLSIRDAFMALRLAVTGEKVGLPLFETLEILGKEESLRRMQKLM